MVKEENKLYYEWSDRDASLVSSSEIDAAFLKYSDSFARINLIGIRCAILLLYNEDIRAPKVKEMILPFYTYSDRDDWSLRNSLSPSEFRLLILSFEGTDDFKRKLLNKLFTAFDTRGKGYIVPDDFQTLMAQVAPKVAKKHGDLLFKSVDTLAIGKRVSGNMSYICYYTRVCRTPLGLRDSRRER